MLGNAPEGEVLTIRNGDDVGYTVPQKLRVANVPKAADVFFRVRRVFNNSVIEVSAGDQTLITYKREHMAPGEMEHILLPRKLLDSVASSEITITAKEA